ncbi:carbamoyl-phosphate synthase, pyrimidine-specific, large chain [Chondrus crispus]|uniref:Carbamoyl phosphate synthase arginine-specific large chain, chloroplastic n=1 Tax=Chondrus crispus TaxID=2769 RepID=R7Q0H8_CHOCR|nr:carbamoyl-phosphate synthase, pyrimidine-specific, large chain [Chondrus crispus]CDF32157.1 carbamoyl-phosphate synthase, pyrimidine-specific, large chain [Chondrus crispus]|eukprot:XP_005711822.1 carbamoyl-phosphate synthase, pyrimidine-specific, large chain [Chondrus crispus]
MSGSSLPEGLNPEYWGPLYANSTKPLVRRTDIKTILLIGAGAIVIGQGAEFDYSGTQACKALRAEGYKVVLVNSNPATIMTDPETADRVYIEPLTTEVLEKIIIIEKPDALLPTMGGQTGLNLATALAEQGILEKYGVELIGAKMDAIQKGEDRLLFRNAMEKIGVKCCKSGIVENMEMAEAVAQEIGSFPLIIRPAFTLGGTGGGIAYNRPEYLRMAQIGIDASPVNQILVEQSLLGWKEYELEVMRDGADNVVIVCSIENVDPMGVHTGDSITVAPTQTLTDREYQNLRDMSLAIIREIGVETGGSNIQFSVNPANGDIIVIEMNPRVSRSSALASKATGFPIAKLAAKLSVGNSLVEVKNDITQKTPACFEPALDYVVTKVPRFAFEKFSGAVDTLSTQMRAVGETMAIGRTFVESFQKALRSLETGRSGWGMDGKDKAVSSKTALESILRVPTPDRIFFVRNAYEMGMSIEDVFELSKYDPWFLGKMLEIFEMGESMKKHESVTAIETQDMYKYKSTGFSDKQMAFALNTTEDEVRSHRKQLGVVPVYKTVDTCAAEFEAYTPYMYSSYDSMRSWGPTVSLDSETPPPTGKKKVVILGQGPNRIGQGIEFDYCCVHACFALRDAGFETVMINSNPETVSTDYDTADRLYFEPLTLEDVIGVLEAEKPDGIVVQFGGQTPLKLAVALEEYLASEEAQKAGLKCSILGTPPDSIDAAEDRDRFMAILQELGIRQPANGIARSYGEAAAIAAEIDYPVVVRPSYVLGGRGMEIVYNESELHRYMSADVVVESEHPVLIDRFLDNAIEVDVDAVADMHGNVVIGGIMEHIEAAGIHSGDSACSLPTISIPYNAMVTIRSWTIALAKRLGVIGLMNVQWAVQGESVFILEANPRASRTVPFVSKAIGQPLAKIASLAMMGSTLKSLGMEKEIIPRYTCVKEAVLPFKKFPGADILLSPEMRSTGEVMGIDDSFAMAYAKAELASGLVIPTSGRVFMSLGDQDKESAIPLAFDMVDLGFKIYATRGTYVQLIAGGLNPTDVEMVLKVHEGRPHVLDRIKNGEVNLFISSPSRKPEDLESTRIVRRSALSSNIPYVTTVAAARALAQAIRVLQTQEITVKAMQDYHKTAPPVVLLAAADIASTL